jgi:very-short-patch-repair endonuclease
MDLHMLRQRASAQHGVISLSQATEFGVNRTRWRTLLRNGHLEELFPDVGLLAGAPRTDLARIKAATLAAGPFAVASHKSAAAVWGVRIVAAEPVHLIAPHRQHRVRSPGLVVHRPTDVLEIAPVVEHGIPTTHPLRTLCDLGAVDAPAVSIALHHLIVRGAVRYDDVRAALQRHRGKGRAGATALEAALDSYALGSKTPDSELEILMAQLFRQHALPTFEFHAIVEGWEVDFLVSNSKVIIETDGWTSHGLDKAQFERDRAKDADLRSAGYIVQRFSRDQVVQRPEWVAARIRSTLSRWAPHLLEHPRSRY